MCADIVSPAKRAHMMSGIKSKNSKPELAIRRQLFALGYRYRLHRRDLPGTPDLVFPKLKTAIFVHGCFWHRHGCSKTSFPSSNSEFWLAKFRANVNRDKRALELLRTAGWRVCVIWECGVSKEGLAPSALNRLLQWLDQAAKGTDALVLP